LEFDDLRMFTESGHSVFSLGTYSDPASKGGFRRPLRRFFTEGDYEAFRASASSGPLQIDPEFAKRFDVAIVNHIPEWIEPTIQAMNGRPVIYRTLGQSNLASEAMVGRFRNDIKVVRYAAGEALVPGFMTTDAVIYFGKYSEDFPDEWIGSGPPVTFHNLYQQRSFATTPSLPLFERLASRFDIALWGAHNEGLIADRGMLPSSEQAAVFRDAAAYVYAPVVPTSYTLSLMEAMAAGVPVLAPTASMIQQTVSRDTIAGSCFSSERYEVTALLGCQGTGSYDTIEEAEDKLTAILQDRDLSRHMSEMEIASFRVNFDAHRIKDEWSEFMTKSV
jgi:glycosyltransferase involved in cell wall biosynthesis